MTAEQLLFPPFRLDLASERLWRDTSVVPLRPKTFAVLRYLAEQRGRLVTNDELLRTVWSGVVVSETMPRLCIREIRRALDDDAKQPRIVETVHRRGYRFIAQVAAGAAPVSSSKFQVPSQQLTGGNQVSDVDSQQLETSNQKLETPLVGREAELAQLHRWWEKARNGERQIVFITGEPGIGKTTLVEAFLAQVAGSDHVRIAQGQCVEQYGAGEAYLPVLEALERLGHEMENGALRALLHRHAPTWLVHLPSLIDPPEREELQRQLAGTGQERMVRELAQALEILTVERPLVLWLEDLHWSDHATLALLTVLARRPEPARLLVLGTYRPADVLSREHRLREVHQELQLHDHCQELALGFLSEAHLAEYLAARFPSPSPALAGEGGGEGLSRAALHEVARLLHRRTEGNPLFMVNVLDCLVTQGVIIQRDGRWEPAGEIEEVSTAMPATLRQFLEQQLDRLSPADQRLLEAASVAGAEFSAAAVAAGVEAAVTVVEERCEILGRHGQFLQVRGSEEWPDGTVATRYGFLHALYQDVLYERVSAGRKVELHRRIGERHEHAYGNRAHEFAVELAMHFERGHDYDRATHYLEAAGKTALRRNAHHEAISHLTKGRELLKTLADTPERAQHELSLQITLGTALMATRGLASPEAEQAYTRARELCRQVNDSRQLCPVLWGLRTYYNGRAEFHTAREVAEQLLTLAQRLEDPELLVNAYLALGNTLYFQGELVAAYEHFTQGSALYDARQHRSLALRYETDPGVGCLCFAAVALWNLGYPERALRRSQEALQRAQEVTHLSSQAVALSLSAALHLNRREVQTVRDHAEAMIALARKQEFSGWLATGTIYRGWALAQQGQAEEGVEAIRLGLTTLRTAGIELNRPRYLMMLAEACEQAGKPDEGLSALTDALALMESTGGRLYEANLYRLRGELLLNDERGTQNDERKTQKKGRSVSSIQHSAFSIPWRPRRVSSKPSKLPVSNTRNHWSCGQ